MGSGLGRKPDFQASIRLVLSGRARRRTTANRQQFQSFAIEPGVDLAGFSETTNSTSRGEVTPLQMDLDDVLTVERKIVTDFHASARPEWELLAHPVFLRHCQVRMAVRLHRGAHARITNGEA